MAATGSVFKRCGCTAEVDGKSKRLGQNCPKLRRADGTWNPRHGTWSFYLSGPAPTPGGRRPQTMRGGFATQADAQRELEALRDKSRRGIAIASKLTVGTYLEEWISSKGDLRLSTARSYRQHITGYLDPRLGHYRLDELRVAHVAEALTDIDVSAATKQRIRGTLRVALNDAIREGLLGVNPAALVKLPSGKRPKALVWTTERVDRWVEAGRRLALSKVTDPDREALEAAAAPPSAVMVWTPVQLGAFLDAAAEDRLYALWHVIAHRGLRRGEACGVEWADIDLDGGLLHVRRQITQLAYTLHESKPKSDAGERTIALDAGSVAALRAHRKRQLQERMAWGEAWNDTGKVFAKEDGSWLHPQMVTLRFIKLTEQAKLPPIRLHDLRHGAASLMLAAGISMKVVQETLGHASSVLTADTYTSVFPQVLAEAAEAAAALVPRAAGKKAT